MTPRDLIARWGPRAWAPLLPLARAAGFDHRKVCDHVWVFRNSTHRVVVSIQRDSDEDPFYAAIFVHVRLTPRDDVLTHTMRPVHVTQAMRALIALGVLPSPTGVAA